VLARTIAQLHAVGEALTRAGVPINLNGHADNGRALGGALREAYSQRTPEDLGTWIERVTAEGSTDSVRARVAQAADRYLTLSPDMSFRSWVDVHAPFDDLEEPDPGDAVDLLTFHGAKGREWQRVVVIGAEHGLVPHTSAVTPAQRDEEARLLYVACTRAREELVVTWAARRNERMSRPSALIAAIADAQVDDVIVPPPNPRPPRPTIDPVYAALIDWRRTAARAAQVEPTTICSDESLRAVAQAKPSTIEALTALTDLGPLAAARIGPKMLAALNRAL